MRLFGDISSANYRKNTCEFLNDIEEEINLFALRVAGLEYWPMLRSIIGHNFEQIVLRKTEVREELREKFSLLGLDVISTKVGLSDKSVLSRISKVKPPKVEEVEALIGQKHSANNFCQYDFLLLSRKTRLILENNSLYHRDFGRLVRQQHIHEQNKVKECAFLELENEFSKYWKGLPTLTIPIDERKYEAVERASQRQIKQHIAEVYGYLRSVLIHKYRVPSNILPSAEQWASYITRNVYSFEETLKVLSQARPRAVFTCLHLDYRHGTFGIVAACNRLGIPTIELMHGVGGNYAWSYTNWSGRHGNQYNTLPTYLATWDETTFSHSLEQLEMGRNCFKPVLISEKYDLDGRKPSARSGTEHEHEQRLKNLKSKYNKLVLFAGQVGEGLIPLSVLEAIVKSPRNWLWFIRLHPEARNSLSDWQQELFSRGIENVDFDTSNRCSIPLLFSMSDAVVSGFSTVLLTNKWRQFPRIATTSHGKEVFEKHIQENFVQFAESGEEIIDLIGKKRTRPLLNSASQSQNPEESVFSHIFRQIS